MRRAIALSLLTAALLPLQALAAAPRSATSFCEGRTGRDAGRCIGDAQKEWARQQKEIIGRQEKDHTEWHLANANKGVTAEYLQLHRDYHAQQKKDREALMEKQRKERETFHAEREEVRKAAQSVTPPTTRPSVSADRLAKGQEVCKGKKSDEEFRACMRPYLRPVDPRTQVRTRIREKPVEVK